MFATTPRWLLVLVLAGLAACSQQDPAEHAEHTSNSHSSEPAAQAPAGPVETDAPAGAYTLDKSHASLLFRVDHLGFSNYTARFKNFDAQLQFDPANLQASRVTASIDARSIETDFPDPAMLDFNAQLRGEQWLNAEQFPEMTFRTLSVEPTGPSSVRMNGELTLRGVTQPVTLDATFNGGYAGHPMDPHARIGFSARGTLKRSAFGMSIGIPEPGSTMGVSDEVEVIIETEFNGPALAGAPGEPASAS